MTHIFVQWANVTLTAISKVWNPTDKNVCVYNGLDFTVFPCANMLRTQMIFKGFACLYLPCRSARPPSMTPCSAISVPLRSKGPGDSYLIIFLSTLPAFAASPLTLLTWATHTGSLWPFGLSSFYHPDGQAKIRQVRPRDRRRILFLFWNLVA